MKFAILFALVASACADTLNVAPAFYRAASSPGFISGGSVYTGGHFVYPGTNFAYPSSNFVQTPTAYSAVAPGNFVHPGSSFVPTTYTEVNPGSIAFRSSVIPSAAVSYKSAPAAAITYSAPIATYSAPIATYSAPAVATYSAVAPIVAPKTIAQTGGSSHITY